MDGGQDSGLVVHWIDIAFNIMYNKIAATRIIYAFAIDNPFESQMKRMYIYTSY